MYKYALVLIAALAGYAVETAHAGHRGFGCIGYGGYGLQVSYGCQGFSMGYGCFGAGCYGGGGWVPVGSGCFGCYGGNLCYGGQGFGMGSGCYGRGGWVPVGYGCAGGYGGNPMMSGYYPADGDGNSSPVVSSSRMHPANPPPAVSANFPQNQRAVPKQQPSAAPVEGNGAAEQIGLPEEKNQGPAPATLIVQLPPDAKLTVNGTATRSTSAKRVLVSPPLERDKEFHYTLKAELVRDGQTLVASQRVIVRGGQEQEVLLEFASPAGRDTETVGPPSNGPGR